VLRLVSSSTSTQVVCTPLYAAPEAVDGQPPTSTPRTDAARNDSLAKDEAVIAAKTAADAHGYGPTGLRVTQTDQDDTIG